MLRCGRCQGVGGVEMWKVTRCTWCRDVEGVRV